MQISQVVFAFIYTKTRMTSRISMWSFELWEWTCLFKFNVNECQQNDINAVNVKPSQFNIQILAASCFSNSTIIPEIEVLDSLCMDHSFLPLSLTQRTKTMNKWNEMQSSTYFVLLIKVTRKKSLTYTPYQMKRRIQEWNRIGM